MNPEDSPSIRFTDLHLPEPLLRALADVGYETPSPIQAATIPALLEGNDLIVGSSRVDLQACKLEYSIVSPK